ncbi:MAG: ABC transporter ATP-binding protein [Acidobacteriota bacterium]|nr:MAG: ABC transporter ATP-binding protein [Acidobacteriota bacterium]
MGSPLFTINQVSCRFDDLRVLQNLDCVISEGEVTGIVGPNGAGKTTLLRILGGLLKSWEGELSFRENSMRVWDQRLFAQQVAYLPQRTQITFPYSAREIVLMGRLPHQSGAFFERAEDHAIAEESLELTGCTHLAERYFTELSGGEQQLVGLASALAQLPQVLLLDEPTAFLDLRHQLQIYRILRDLQKERALSLILVTHDLNLAENFCDRLLFLKDGKLVEDLRKENNTFALTGPLIEKVFGITAQKEASGRFILSYGN